MYIDLDFYRNTRWLFHGSKGTAYRSNVVDLIWTSALLSLLFLFLFSKEEKKKTSIKIYKVHIQRTSATVKFHGKMSITFYACIFKCNAYTAVRITWNWQWGKKKHTPNETMFNSIELIVCCKERGKKLKFCWMHSMWCVWIIILWIQGRVK